MWLTPSAVGMPERKSSSVMVRTGLTTVAKPQEEAALKTGTPMRNTPHLGVVRNHGRWGLEAREINAPPE